jgi:hypothetical protein
MSLKELKTFTPLTALNLKEQVYPFKAAEQDSPQETDLSWDQFYEPDKKFLDALDVPLDAIKTGIDTLYVPVKAALELLEKLNALYGVVSDPAKSVLETLKSQMDAVIDSIGGSGGVYIMYKSPFDLNKDKKVISNENAVQSAKKLDDFWDFLRSSVDVEEGDTLFVTPQFGPDEYVCGVSLLMLAPAYKEMYDSIKELLKMFSIEFWSKQDSVLQSIVHITASFEYIKIFKGDKKHLRLNWNKFNFPHKIKISEFKAIEDKTGNEVDLIITLPNTEFYNVKTYKTADKQKKEKGLVVSRQDVVGIDEVILLYSHTYVVKIEMYVTEEVANELSKSSTNLYAELVGNHISRDKYAADESEYTYLLSSKTVTFHLASELAFKERFQQGAESKYGDGQWFGITLENLFPELSMLKNKVKTFVDSLLTQMTSKVDSLTAIVNAINKRVSLIEKTITSIRNSVFAFLNKLKVTVAGDIINVKIIKPQLGGMQKYINDVANSQGISKQMLRDANFVGGIFIVAGGRDPAQLESIINFFRLLVDKQSNDQEFVSEIARKPSELSSVLSDLSGFNLSGEESTYKSKVGVSE